MIKNILEKLSSWAVFHKEIHFILLIVHLIQLGNVLMSQFFANLNFELKRPLLLVCHLFGIDDLDSHRLTSYDMNSFFNFGVTSNTNGFS